MKQTTPGTVPSVETKNLRSCSRSWRPLMKLHRDLKEFIELLKSREVEYLVIGGWAFGFHATPRYTGDFDFFVRCTAENAVRLREALLAFGFEELAGFEDNFLQGDRILQFGVPPSRIDILTKISGVDFEDVWS